MPHISQLKESKYISKGDVIKPLLLTITSCQQEQVKDDSGKMESKWCLYFEEIQKPLILNVTNGDLIAGITGSEDTDDWTGHKIVLYVDPNVMMGREKKGGVRARAPKNQAGPAKPPVKRPPPPTADEYDHGDAYEGDEC